MGLVQVIALGGAGEIGKSCTVVRQADDIVVLDCGLAFPSEEMLGVDIVLPDFTYLYENAEKVRGIFLTHAHEDHVGSLPYLLKRVNVPVYASEFTHALMRSKLEERIDVRKCDLRTFQFGQEVEVGTLGVEPVRVTHSAPQSASFAVRTEHGVILLTGDFKFDFTPVDGKLSDVTRFGELGREGVVLLLCDSTNVERPGWGPSERLVRDGLLRVFLESEGRVLLTTFASNIHRMQQVYEVAEQTGRKVAVVGRRMEQSLEVCARMGFASIPPNTQTSLEDLGRLRPEELVILTTGSQGEPMSALVQMSKGEYGRLSILPGDTVIYSARPIPGNEAAVWRTMNRLIRQGARVVYETEPPVHVSGHAYQEEMKMLVNLTRPFYIAPIHGEPRHQYRFKQMALQMGYPEHRIFTLDDGLPLILDEKEAYLGDPVHCGRVLVDNSGAPGVTDEVLRDRTNLANDGLVAVTVAVDPENGDVVGEPILQAKGFHDPDGTLEAAAQALVEELDAMNPDDLRDVDKLRHEVADVVRRFIRRRTSLRPLVVPTIVEV